LDLFDRYLYTEREHPFDLDQTRATISSSPSQYSETNSLDNDDDDGNTLNGNSYNVCLHKILFQKPSFLLGKKHSTFKFEFIDRF
jgi:hypothetical protein